LAQGAFGAQLFTRRTLLLAFVGLKRLLRLLLRLHLRVGACLRRRLRVLLTQCPFLAELLSLDRTIDVRRPLNARRCHSL
jgi:hypothetical protein